MSNRTSAQRAARLLQKLTGWTYTWCLRISKERDAEGIEVLFQKMGFPIDKKSEHYVAWRKRASWAVEHAGD